MKQFLKSILEKVISPFVGSGIGNYFPFKQIRILILKILGTHQHSYKLYKTAYQFKMHLSKLDCVDLEIIKTGKWEANISSLFEKYLKKGDTFLDIGANIGYDSLLASTLIGETGKVISFEPSPTIFDRLSKNIEINNFKNIETHKVGVGNKFFETRIYYDAFNPGASSIVKTKNNKEYVTENVKIVTIDDYLPKNLKVDFIKMDIEGFEYEAILGMENILKNNNLKMIFEFSPGIYGKEKGIQILEKLTSLGFKISHIELNGNLTKIENLKKYTDGIEYQSDIFCKKI